MAKLVQLCLGLQHVHSKAGSPHARPAMHPQSAGGSALHIAPCSVQAMLLQGAHTAGACVRYPSCFGLCHPAADAECGHPERACAVLCCAHVQ